MKQVLIDLGNSRLKYAEVDGEQLLRAYAVNHGDGEWRQIFRNGLVALTPPARVLLASVAHEMVAQAALAVLAEVWPQVPVQRAASEAALGRLRTDYHEPARLGVDRFLCALAAAEAAEDILVIGCGTALTADFIDRDGRHHGGWIAPGPDSMRAAVLARTARVHWLRTGHVQDFATNTENALESGAWHACAGMVERAMRAAQAQCATPPRVWLHGGDAERLAGMLIERTEFQHDLVFRGLLLWARGR